MVKKSKKTSTLVEPVVLANGVGKQCVLKEYLVETKEPSAKNREDVVADSPKNKTTKAHKGSIKVNKCFRSIGVQTALTDILKATQTESVPPHLPVDDMTSREFQLDNDAHIETMTNALKDERIIKIFQQAIFCNKHLFKDSIVLDLHCGLGLLSLFAVKAGAKHVYAVDPSNVADYMQRIVAANGYGNVITVIKGNVEEIELPKQEQVDIIICNWMGSSLFFQTHADAVIFARDKWLKKNGVIMPDKAYLYINIINDQEFKNSHIEWWTDVYGFNMKCLRKPTLYEPVNRIVYPDQELSSAVCVKKLDLNTATLMDLKCREKFRFIIRNAGIIDGVVASFSVKFSRSHTKIRFDTHPISPVTKWMQTVYYFDKPIVAQLNNIYIGGFEMLRWNSEQRFNDLQINLELYYDDGSESMELVNEMQWRFLSNSEAGKAITETKNSYIAAKTNAETIANEALETENTDKIKEAKVNTIIQKNESTNTKTMLVANINTNLSNKTLLPSQRLLSTTSEKGTSKTQQSS